MCGVIGVFAPAADGGVITKGSGEAARMAYFGLHALQHRGQESAGIAVGDGRTVMTVKNLGLVAQVFNETDLKSLPGHIALGHTRYSTTGGAAAWENAQPHMSSIGQQLIALAHNGNLTNTDELHARLAEDGVHLRSDSDSEAIAALVGQFTKSTSHIREGIRLTMELIRGAYAVGIITESALYAFRDPLGIRPLCLGELPAAPPEGGVGEGAVGAAGAEGVEGATAGIRGTSSDASTGGGWVVASETTGLDILGARYVRDIEPGEVVKISEEGVETLMAVPAPRRALCIFEYVYFARPDSEMAGLSMYEARRRMGQTLAKEAPVEADLVVGVPDGGTPGAVGFAKASGIPYGEGLAKNRYVGRTFIQPSQALRRRGIRLKLNPMRHAVEGKRVIVVDDSIVRGNTTKALVEMLREAGAVEVHMRITSPPVAWPCFFGIDTDTRAQLIGAQKDVDEIRKHVGADSLAYLSVDGMVAATGMPRDSFCLACFDGNYPLDVSHNLAKEGSTGTIPLL